MAALSTLGEVAPLILSLPKLTAEVGSSYSYDADGMAVARGSKTIGWRLGKVVGGELVGLSVGMGVGTDGVIDWTPSKDQVGVESVVLIAENAAGFDVQTWEVIVTDPNLSKGGGSGGCGCSGTSQRSLLWLALVVLFWRHGMSRSTRS